MMPDRPMGPNAKKLFAAFLAKEAVPDGGGLADSMKFFLDKEHRAGVIERAAKNFEAGIAAVKAAPDNPYGDDEEAICAAVLARLAQDAAGGEAGDAAA